MRILDFSNYNLKNRLQICYPANFVQLGDIVDRSRICCMNDCFPRETQLRINEARKGNFIDKISPSTIVGLISI